MFGTFGKGENARRELREKEREGDEPGASNDTEHTKMEPCFQSESNTE